MKNTKKIYITWLPEEIKDQCQLKLQTYPSLNLKLTQTCYQLTSAELREG